MCKILNLRVLARCLSLVWGKKKKRASRQTFVGAVKTGFYVDAGPGLWSGVEAVQGLWNESLAWVALCQQSSSSLPPTLAGGLTLTLKLGRPLCLLPSSSYRG
jgi:hypothetical protein